MATYWTLKTGGTEKQLADWGIVEGFSSVRSNKRKSTVRLQTTERFDPGATQWNGPTISAGVPVHTQAVIYRDRSSTTGNPNTFSAGTVYFVGYFDDPRRSVVNGEEGVEYQLHNVLWLFERNAFKQYYYQFTGFDATHQRVVAASVAAGGASWKVGDTFNINGGTGTAATGIVTNIGGGGASGPATLVAITNGGGSYTVTPASPANTTATGGSAGTGLTLSLTFGEALTLQKVVCSEVYLGENAQQGYAANWSNGDQALEIFNWMNETYNPTRRGTAGPFDTTQDVLQVGTIDPKTYVPTTRQNTVSCLESLNVILRPDTDSVIVEDPTTSVSGVLIPTLHVRKLARWNYATTPPTFLDYTNLTEITVTLTSDQEDEVIAQIQNSKVLPGVIIYYKWVDLVDSVASPHLAIDKADANGSAMYVDGVKIYGSGTPTITDWTPEVSSHTFNLVGATASHVKAIVKGTPIALLFSNPSIWWGAHDRSLYGPEVPGSFSADSAEVVDDSGNPIDTGVYAYELQGPLPAWVGGQVIRATVRQHLHWNRNKLNYPNVPTQLADEKPHTQRVQLTNIAPGTYSTLGSASDGVVLPFGVAESAYRSAAAVQWAGKVSFTKSQLRQDLRSFASGPNNVGIRLKLIGPNTTFSNLLVQEVEEQPQYGVTRVTFGPSAPVDVDQWVTLAMASRARWSWTMPSGRGDGTGSGSGGGGGNVDLSQDPALDNSSQMAGGLSRDYTTHKFS